MANEKWRLRLEAALKTSDKSKRDVSLASGNGPGYMHSILSEGKEPKINNLIAICEQLGVSVIHILYGIELSPDEAELLTAVRDHPEKRAAILSLLAS